MCWIYYGTLFIAAFQVVSIDGFVNGTWKQLGQTLIGEVTTTYCDDDDRNYPDGFGASVSTSADGLTIAVGAMGNSHAEGRTEVYHFDATSEKWKQMGQTIVGMGRSGNEVVLSDDGTTIVGGYVDRFFNGYVRLSKYNTSTKDWEQVGPDLFNNTAKLLFSGSLGMSADGTVIALYLFKWNQKSFKSDGLVIRVYTYSALSSQWEQIEISGDGTTVAVSTVKQVLARFSDHSYTSSFQEEVATIHVYKFNMGSDQWEQLGPVVNGYAGEKYFGKALALSTDGTIMALAAISLVDDNSDYGIQRIATQKGRGRVYMLNPSSFQWEQIGDDLDVAHGGIALSSDGDMIALGTLCPYNFSSTINGDLVLERSCVNTYKFDVLSSQWYSIGLITTAPRDEYYGDAFGRSIGMSADATVIAIGAPSHPDLENFVEIFQFEQAISKNPLPFAAPVKTPIALPVMAPIINQTEVPITAPLATNAPIKTPSISTAVPVSAPVGTPMVGGDVKYKIEKLSGDGLNSLRGGVHCRPSDKARIGLDHFGRSISTSSDGLTIAVGAERGGDVNDDRYGYVQVFQYNKASTKWGQLGLDILPRPDDQYFGRVVIMSADATTILIGSYVRVNSFKYNLSSNTWEQIGSDIFNNSLGDQMFGLSLAMASDASWVAVPVYDWDASGNMLTGTVRVYRDSELSNQREQANKELYGVFNIGQVEYDSFVIEMSNDGTTFAVGTMKRVYSEYSRKQYDEIAEVRVYKLNVNSNQWDLLGDAIVGFPGTDFFNKAMAISADGTMIAIPSVIVTQVDAFYMDGNRTQVKKGRGRVYKYHPLSNQWKQVGGDLAIVQKGIVMSSDGGTIAIGTSCPDLKNPTMICNCVIVYKLDLYTQWFKIGSIRSPSDSFLDRYGEVMDMSSDGTIIAVGARNAELYEWSIVRPVDIVYADGFADIVEIYQFSQVVTSPVTAPTPIVTPVATKAPTLTKQPITIAPVEVPVRTPIIAPVPPPRTATKSPSKQPTVPVVAVPVMSPVTAEAPLTNNIPPTTTTTTLHNCKIGNATAVVTYNLYDSRTDTFVATITNGTIITTPPSHVNRTNIEAVIPCNDIGAMRNSTVVEIQLYNNSSHSSNNTAMIHHRIERYSKYFLFGDNGRNIYNGRIVPGTYQIRVIVNQTMTSPFTTFTIV